ncbi:MAG: O-antigen ligase family protein [Muribaculaceae bacterium]|nr:O-antigen ligase family protein [Muribaculaceae bacterium]
MTQLATIILTVVVWIISFVGPSGWSESIHLPEKINIAICVSAFIIMLRQRNEGNVISGKLAGAIILTLIIIPFIISGKWEGASYCVALLIVYIFSHCRITTTTIRLSAIIIAGLGLVVLFIYSNGSILSGWNDNAISMVGLFSFIYFSTYLIEIKNSRSFWIWNIVTILYLQLLYHTDCRSGMLFSTLAVICILYSGFTKRKLRNPKIRLLLLNIPLVVAIITLIISYGPHFNELNNWSIRNFDKEVFNSREILWNDSWESLIKSCFLGTGKFEINYHNSGVAALTVFGILGYVCWIKYFSNSMNAMSRYLKDNIVFGCMLAFTLIFLQQSVDLGFISKNPNFLPYMILGTGIGRMRTLYQKSRI